MVAINLVNVLVTGIMLSRPAGLETLESAFGLATIALALPAGSFAILNARWKRDWWTYVLPALLVSYLVVELVLDYILTVDFRGTVLLGPYLLLFYVSIWGMIGYSFLVDKRYGVATLATYFTSLAATWYSITRVGY